MGMPAWTHPDRRKPFGFVMDNGLNFAKSIHDPKSLVRRILKVVWESDMVLTKKQILNELGYYLDIPHTTKWNYTYTCHPARGYLSYYFAGLHKAGWLVPIRTHGNTVRWFMGPNFPTVACLIDLEGVSMTRGTID